MGKPAVTTNPLDLIATLTARVTALEARPARDDGQDAKIADLTRRVAELEERLSNVISAASHAGELTAKAVTIDLTARIAAVEGRTIGTSPEDRDAIRQLLEWIEVERSNAPVRETSLLGLLERLEARYVEEVRESSGEGSAIGPRMRREIAARAKRELVRELVAELRAAAPR